MWTSWWAGCREQLRLQSESGAMLYLPIPKDRMSVRCMLRWVACTWRDLGSVKGGAYRQADCKCSVLSIPRSLQSLQMYCSWKSACRAAQQVDCVAALDSNDRAMEILIACWLPCNARWP